MEHCYNSLGANLCDLFSYILNHPDPSRPHLPGFHPQLGIYKNDLAGERFYQILKGCVEAVFEITITIPIKNLISTPVHDTDSTKYGHDCIALILQYMATSYVDKHKRLTQDDGHEAILEQIIDNLGTLVSNHIPSA